MNQTESSLRRPLNNGSELLTLSENQKLFNALGPNQISLVAGITQFFNSCNDRIQHTNCGILSFVKDYDEKLFVLILFNRYTFEKLWFGVLHKDFTVKSDPNCKNLLLLKNNAFNYEIIFESETEARDFRIHLEMKSEVDKTASDKPLANRTTSLPHNNISTTNKPPIQAHSHSLTHKHNVPSKINFFESAKNEYTSNSQKPFDPIASFQEILKLEKHINNPMTSSSNDKSMGNASSLLSETGKPMANVKPYKRNDESDSSSSDSEDDIALNEQELASAGIKQFDRNNLEYVRKLGNGNFGVVSKYEVKDQTLIPHKFVAVKEIDKSISADIREVKNFGQLKHENIVDFIGYYEDQRSIYIVMEFLPNDNLYEYLLNYENKFTIGQAFDMLLQIINGMTYLHSLNIIHRDLAARNCMFLVDKQLVKINDFGLSRNLYEKEYYRQTNRCFPIAWTALECLKGGPFTKMSDVWSFGVLMWEVFARQEPYPEIRAEHELISILSKRQRLKRPVDSCSPNTYNLMRSCWSKSAKKRPNFEDLREKIQLILKFMNNDGEMDVNEEEERQGRSGSGDFVYTSSLPVKAFRNKNTNAPGLYV